MTYLYLLTGLTILLVGAHYLIGNIIDLAKRLNVSQFLIATCTIAIGTSLPELSASIKSVASDHSGIAVGNLIGSNIANIFLVVGLSSIIYPIKALQNTNEDILKIEGIAGIFIFLFPATILWLKLDGFNSILVSVLAILIFLYFFRERITKEKLNVQVSNINDSIFYLVLKNIFFLTLLIIGCDILINNTVKLSENYNISERIIGLSLVAIGTSLPELTICVTAALKRKQGIALGTVLGSNMYNILVMLSIVEIYENTIGNNGAILTNIKPVDLIFLLLSTLLLIIFYMQPAKKPRNIDRLEGSILFVFYMAYIYFIYTT